MLLEAIYSEVKKHYMNSILGFQLGDRVVFINQDAKAVQRLTNAMCKFIDDGNTIISMVDLSIEEARRIPRIEILKEENKNGKLNG